MNRADCVSDRYSARTLGVVMLVIGPIFGLLKLRRVLDNSVKQNAS